MAQAVLVIKVTSEGDVKVIKETTKDLKGAGRAAEQTSKDMGGLKRAAQFAAVGFAAFKVAQKAGEFLELGANVQATRKRFEAFAGGPEAAAKYLDAFTESTDGAIDRMSAMGGGAKLLQMGLVDTAEEMGTVAAVAVKLGDQTLGANQRLADFAATLANRSIPRLDNFGISSGKVRARVEELKKSGHDLDQAFKLAVLEEGQKSLARLGDTSELAATKIAKMRAALADAKTGFAEIAAEDASATLEILARDGRTLLDVLRDMPGALREYRAELQENISADRISTKEVLAAQRAERLRIAIAKERRWTLALERDAVGYNIERWDQYSQALEMVPYAATTSAQRQLITVTEDSAGAWNQYQAALVSTRKAEDDAAMAVVRHRDELARLEVVAQRHKEFVLDAWMAVTSYMEEATDLVADCATRREEIEERHQEELTKLRERGAVKAVRIDAEAEDAKLAQLRRNLEIALQQQTEFTEKTNESTRMRKEDQIAALQEEIGEQEAMLASYYAGTLVQKGENVNGLLGEEERRYQTELEMQSVARAEQETALRQSLGRMALEQFTAWAKVHKLSDTEMYNMRLGIAEQYGLLTADARLKVENMTLNWAAGVAVMRGEASGFFDYFSKAFNALPSEKVIKIRYELSKPKMADPGRQGGETMQHGGRVHVTKGYLVGERGPEFVELPGGAYVHNAGRTAAMGREVSVGGRGGGGGGPTVIVNQTIHFGPGSVRSDDDIRRIGERLHRLQMLSGGHYTFEI